MLKPTTNLQNEGLDSFAEGTVRPANRPVGTSICPATDSAMPRISGPRGRVGDDSDHAVSSLPW